MSPGQRYWHFFVPKLFTVLREGYSLARLRDDAIAGLTVAIVALPLAMALAIASGTTPERGLFTAIVAGFLISALGGSRFQIGGPTGAFVVVVFNTVQAHGYDGLVLATIMAGIMLVIAGLLRAGTIIKYIPYPVITGFTAGIAVIIFSSQVKDLLGLDLANPPAEFIDKWIAYGHSIGTADFATCAVAALALTIIIAIRRYRPSLPGFLIAVVACSLLVALVPLSVETIGSRFGQIPNMLPQPSFPEISMARLQALLPDALTIAFLAGIESLLSAMVADGMTGRRHRSNVELMAQGIANIASPIFGGIPATGAIARTATNIKAGAVSPVAGMLHAVFLLVFMLALAPLASYLPLAALAAVLVIVAWNMSEIERFRHLLRAPPGDRIVLLLTFFLTVLVDLTVAIQVGVVLAALLFMYRMAQTVEVTSNVALLEHDRDELAEAPHERYRRDDTLPDDVEVFTISGPFFFGATSRLQAALDRVTRLSRVFILRMEQVPVIDASGAQALADWVESCGRRGTQAVLVGVQAMPRLVLKRMNLQHEHANLHFFPDMEAALAFARVAKAG
jgi:SulP family sulfate permease